VSTALDNGQRLTRKRLASMVRRVLYSSAVLYRIPGRPGLAAARYVTAQPRVTECGYVPRIAAKVTRWEDPAIQCRPVSVYEREAYG
jgi:hypothetical protein